LPEFETMNYCSLHIGESEPKLRARPATPERTYFPLLTIQGGHSLQKELFTSSLYEKATLLISPRGSFILELFNEIKKCIIITSITITFFKTRK